MEKAGWQSEKEATQSTLWLLSPKKSCIQEYPSSCNLLNDVNSAINLAYSCPSIHPTAHYNVMDEKVAYK